MHFCEIRAHVRFSMLIFNLGYSKFIENAIQIRPKSKYVAENVVDKPQEKCN